PMLITAKKTISAENLQEFIAWLRANPSKAAQGHSGFGGMAHVAGLLLQKETGTSFQSVPYRGGSQAVQDLLAGHIDFTMGPAADTLPQIRLGSVKVFAVAAKRRLAAAPDIPTVDEAGLPGLHLSLWMGLWVPKGTPGDIVVKLNAAVVDALAEP